MIEKPSIMFAKMLRDESRFCQNANAAALLQEVAAWLGGGTIFEEPRKELWEHADRLCGGTAKPLTEAEKIESLRKALIRLLHAMDSQYLRDADAYATEVLEATK